MLLEDGEDAVDVNVLCICNRHGAAAPTRPPVPASLLQGLPIANCPRPRPPHLRLHCPLLSFRPSLHILNVHSVHPRSLTTPRGRAYRHAAKHAAAAPESLSGGRVDSGHHQSDARDRVRPPVRQTDTLLWPASPTEAQGERARDREVAFGEGQGQVCVRNTRWREIVAGRAKRAERRCNANAIYRGAAK